MVTTKKKKRRRKQKKKKKKKKKKRCPKSHEVMIIFVIRDMSTCPQIKWTASRHLIAYCFHNVFSIVFTPHTLALLLQFLLQSIFFLYITNEAKIAG